MALEVKVYVGGSPISIEPDASAIAALERMIEHAIRPLPIGRRRTIGVWSPRAAT